MISTNQFKVGMTIRFENDIYRIVEYQHVKPGKGGAFVRTKLKNAKTGLQMERTFRPEQKFEQLRTENHVMTYLYDEPDQVVFMDAESYDQLFIPEKALGDAKNYVKEGIVLAVSFYKGNALGVDLPNFVDLKIAKTEPGMKGDTAQNATKPAELESGYTIQVPLFLEEGDVVKIDTRSGQYIERVSR